LIKQSSDLDNSVDLLVKITTDIQQTTADAISMDNYTKNVTKSVELGQTLANKTTMEMEQIVDEIASINDAITVIDKIAFQTNILSLNAAIEAATAGEAGKGFAVVAQEVRNLANKSAQAAKEIKELVESATSKANDGKIISNNMKDGYTELNEHIDATIELIHNVTQASQNQQVSIEEIKDKMSDIKLLTNQSSKMAVDVAEITKKTNDLATTIVTDAQNKKF
jgi:methyl-accepting chemotaxis protein